MRGEMSPSPGFSKASIFILLWRADGSVAYDSVCVAILDIMDSFFLFSPVRMSFGVENEFIETKLWISPECSDQV